MTDQIDGDYIVGYATIDNEKWRCRQLNENLFLSYTVGLNTLVIHRKCHVHALIGLIYNPHIPSQDIQEIAEQIAETENPNQVATILNIMAGSYVVLSIWGHIGAVFTDACSLRKVYYMMQPHKYNFMFSSSDILLAKYNHCLFQKHLSINVLPNTRIGETGYLPGSLSPYKGIKHLIPNHFLKLPQNIPVRYYPALPYQEDNYTKSLDSATKIIAGSAESIVQRFPHISIALTAGYDSRTSLAAFACSANKKYHTKINCFTFKYPYLDDNDMDLTIPHEICSAVGISHHTIPVDVPQEAERYLVEMFGKETYLVVSVISDIFRVFYRLPNLALTPHFMIKKERIPHNDETIEALKEWFLSLDDVNKSKAYNIFDFFYWENRIARWATKGFSGSGLDLFKVNIFNSRELLNIALQTDKSKRLSGQFNKDIIESLRPGLAKIPFNPPQTIKDRIKNIFSATPAEKWLRFFYILLSK